MSEAPRDPMEPIGWRVPRSLKFAIKQLALERQTTVEEQARQALVRHLEEARREQQRTAV